jgi:hypothetical protein
MKEISVRIKNNYGPTAYYPACEGAAHFCKIANTSTLTPHVIQHIKALGYTVKVEQTTQPKEL